MPQHNHTVSASSSVPGKGSGATPTSAYLAAVSGIEIYESSANTTMGSNMIASAGGGEAHTNIQPVLAVTFIICLVGILPTRN